MIKRLLNLGRQVLCGLGFHQEQEWSGYCQAVVFNRYGGVDWGCSAYIEYHHRAQGKNCNLGPFGEPCDDEWCQRVYIGRPEHTPKPRINLTRGTHHCCGRGTKDCKEETS